MPDLTTSETLNLAADLIEERGWIGRGWSHVKDDPWGGGAAGSGPLCIEGGIMAALGLELPAAGLDARGAVITAATKCPAYAAVQHYLADRMNEPDDAIWRWNDRKGRTQAEVIAVLRATAVIESAREVRTALAGLPDSEVPA